MHIEIDDLTRPEVLALLNDHLTNMYALSPPESVHALDVSTLRAPDITFWTAWVDGGLPCARRSRDDGKAQGAFMPAQKLYERFGSNDRR